MMLSTHQKWPPLYIAFFAFSFLLVAQWPASYLIQDVSITLGILLNEWGIILGISLLMAFLWKIPFKTMFPFQKARGAPFLWAIISTLCLLVIIDYLTFLSEQLWPPPPEIKTMLEKVMTVETLGDGVWRWFLICLTPAICEEIFFRGFFQNTLNHYLERRWSLFLTAVFFALIHGIVHYWPLYFLLGLFLSYLMLAGQNLVFPIVAHLLNNSWTFLSHVLGYKIPRGETWQNQDTLVFGVCVIIFILAIKGFTRCVKRSA